MGALPSGRKTIGEGRRVGRGPYRILVSEFNAPRDPMALGNPAEDRAVAEITRLFGVNAELARGILGSVPIVIFTDLDGPTAGLLAKRLISLVELGCQITTTTRVADDLPCMNWPELPPIAAAAFDDEPPARAAAAPPPAHSEGLSCPSCGQGLKLVPDDGAAPPRHRQREQSRSSAPAPEPAPEPEPEPDEDDGDDWMATPKSMGPAPQPRREVSKPSTRRKSTRFDNPALLKASPPPPQPDPLRSGEPQASASATAVEEDELRVELSNSSIEELTDFEEDEPTAATPPSTSAAPNQFESDFGADLGWESDGDLTPIHESEDDLDPIRGPASEDDLQPIGGPAAKSSNGFDDDLGGLSDLDSAELIEDSTFGTPASTSDVFGSREGRAQGKAQGRDPFEDSDDVEEGLDAFGLDSGESGPGLEDSGSDLLDQDPPHRLGSSRFRSDLDFLDEPSSPSRAFDDLDELADPPKSKSRSKPARGGGEVDPSLSAVLETFGPEDSQPLDSLDPSPPSLGRRDSGRRGAADMSDILEPLDPDEALKIMKSKRVDSGRSHARASTATASNHRVDDDPSSLEPPDPDEAKALLASEQPPLDESDDDLFGDPPPRRKQTDPFARTRKRKEEPSRGRGSSRKRTEEPSRGRGSSRKRKEEPSRGRSGRSSKRDSGRTSRRSGTDAKRSGRKRAAKPKGGPGKHGLVLSRILDPDKKEVAAELIKEIRGLSLDEARRLTDRTIIPVLKDVTREEAQYHLDTFKDRNIAGRITTRQR